MHQGQTDQKVKINFYYFLIYFSIRSTDLLFVSEYMLRRSLASNLIILIIIYLGHCINLYFKWRRQFPNVEER